MSKTILFVTYGGGHAHMVYPVIHALRASPAFQSGALTIRTLGLPSAKAILNRNGVECLGFTDYLRPAEDADALRWGTELAQKHHSPTLGIPLEDSVAYLGLNYKDMVTRLGPEAAATLFAEKGRNAFYPITVMQRILDDIRPDVVVTTNAPRSEAAAIEAANARGIETLIMTDLFTGMMGYRMKAKHITFINAFAMQKFKADGLLAEGATCHYTGNPAFDKILSLPQTPIPGWLEQHFPKAAGKKIVLHADMPAYWNPHSKTAHFKTGAESIEELDACYHAAMENDAAYLIRPHPSQARALFESWLHGRKDAYLAAECDLHQLLRHSDLVLARSTTVGLEAAYMRRKVLQLDYGIHTDLPLKDLGIAWGVNGYEGLSAEMRHALTDTKRYEDILKKIPETLPDTPAASSIAAIIESRLNA